MQQRETSVVVPLHRTGRVALAAVLVALAGCGQKGPLTVSTTASAPAPVSQLAPSVSQPASVPR